MLHIYVDADACPVKEEVYRVARRYKLPVTLVANAYIRTPEDNLICFQQVPSGPDEADDWIAESADVNDIVVTADIPLAYRCVKKGACVLSSKGVLFTEANIGSMLATRDLLADLRDSGEMTGGPPPFQARDRSNFLQRLDTVIQKIRRDKDKKER